MLGDTGTRARIMMLLLWIIGHRLSEDSVAKLVSTAVGDAMQRDGNVDLETELASLDSVKRVLTSLQKMIKTKIPLPPGVFPTMKLYCFADEYGFRQKSISRSRLQRRR